MFANVEGQRVRLVYASGIGPQGPAGTPGVGVWRGAWSALTTYAVNDLVQSAGSTYFCIQASTNNTPASSPTYWELVAAKGDTGAQGTQGVAGPQGAVGPAGPQGAVGPAGPASTLLELTDGPGDYTGAGGFGVVVNATADGFEFKELSGTALFEFAVTTFTVKESGTEVSIVERGKTVADLHFQWAGNAGYAGDASITPGPPYEYAFDDGDAVAVGVNATDPGGGAYGQRVYTLSANGSLLSAHLHWYSRAFYGFRAASTIDEAGIEALNSALYEDVPTTVINVTGNVGTRYMYYAQPASWTVPTRFRDENNGLLLDMTALGDVTVANAYGDSRTYKVWRTTNATAVSSIRIGVE